MAASPLILRYAARSHVGLVRAKNDDSAYAGRYLAVVADGMGGHAGGDVASASTVLDLIHLDQGNYTDDAGTRLADEIQTANSLLSELVHANPKLAGMGTTVTSLLLTGDRLAFAHIGDSRAYRLKDGVFEQMSVDHTFVQRMIEEGRMTEAEAEVHPHKNVLMRVLGDVDASPELDLKYFDAAPGERWLLCSDGLNFVRHAMVEEVIRHTKVLSTAADTLIKLTLDAGSPDNVTVVVFDVVESSPDDEAELEGISSAAFPATEALPTASGQADDEPSSLQLESENSDDSEERTPEELDAHIRAAVVRQELSQRPHELVGAAVTANAEGKIPLLVHRPARQRAAAVLTHKTQDATAPIESPEESLPHYRYRKLVLSVVGSLVVIAVVTGGWLSYSWTQTQYFVGTSNGKVAIFNGVSQKLGPISLSHLQRETSVAVESLPEYSQQLVTRTMPASSLSIAEQIISDLQLGTGSSTPPCEAVTNHSPSSSSSSTATTSPSSGALASPKPTSSTATATATAGTVTPTPSCIPGGGQ